MIKKEIPLLTTIRFFAASLILLFHLEIRWPLTFLPQHIANVLNQGAIGMSLFFVLSGFVLAYNYDGLQPIKKYKDFIIRRFARIYPIYCFAALLLLPWLGLAIANHSMVFVTSRYAFIFFTNIFLIQGWFPQLFSYWNDNASWSLSVEAFCYVLFPIILYGLQLVNEKKLLLVLLVAYIFTILPGIAYLLYPENAPTMPTIYALPIFRLSEFVVGMVVALFFIRQKKCPEYVFLKVFVALFLMFIYLGFIASYMPKIYIINNFIVVPVFALCIYWLASKSKGYMVVFFGNRFFRLLGEASYCLYLLQVLFIYIYKDYSKTIQHYFPLAHHNSVVWFIIVLFSIVFSIIAHFIIEKPLRRIIIERFTQWETQTVETVSSNYQVSNIS